MSRIFLLFEWVLQLVHFLADCLMAAFLYLTKAFGFSRPGIGGIVRTALIFGVTFLLTVVCNRYLIEKVTDVGRLISPVMLESGYLKLKDGYDVSYGFDLASNHTNKSFFRLSHGDLPLFEIVFFTESNGSLDTGLLRPRDCTALKVSLPSKLRLKNNVSVVNSSSKINGAQAIYEICKYSWPFPGVLQPQIFLDRQSLLELLKQEFNDVISEVGSSKDGAVDGEKSKEKETKETSSTAQLSKEQQIAVKDVFLQHFLSVPDILGDNTRQGDNKCGKDQSVLDRICDVQTAMFTNGPIQFVSLLVFFFGLTHLVLLFILGVVAPWWVNISRCYSGFWGKTSATTVSQFLNLQHFSLLYPELSSPIVAAIEILPMIGFFGTIIGISGAMTEVAGVKSTDKIISLLALGSMTTNIGVAFETTKFALILSGILLALKLMTDRAHALSTEATDK